MLVNLELKNLINSEKLAHLYIITGLDHNKRLESIQNFIYDFFKDKINDKKLYEKIKNFEFYSLFYLNSYDRKIKKDEILDLQEEFSKTSLAEKERFFIIDGIENISTQAANSLLKFLEEPNSKYSYGFLLSENINMVLDTIISRAIVINLGYNNKELVIKELIEKELLINHAILLKELSSDINYLLFLNNEASFLKLKDLFYNTVSALNLNSSLLLSLINEIDFELNIEIFQNYFNFLLLFFKDVLNMQLKINKVNFVNLDSEIKNISKTIKKEKIYLIIEEIYKFNKKINFGINLKLAFNNFFIQIDNIKG